MTRDEALALLQKHVSSDTLIKHALATEAIMRTLAEKLGYDVEKWGLTGLLHDLDYDVTKDNPPAHTEVAAGWLRNEGCDEEMINTIRAHNAEALGIERVTDFDFALTAAETITGLVVATTLVYPDKKLASVKPKSITKRMKEKQFAASVNRDNIRLCEKLGISTSDFAALSLEAMRGVAADLGL